MADSLVAPVPTLDAAQDPQAPPALPALSPVVITAQEVVLSTAAAVPLRRERAHHRLTVMLRAMLASRTDTPARRRTHNAPPRSYYLEHARMARAMQRL
ncbi:MAG: hypothetical protein JO330_12765 [Mycobacteriaceae bacterium]|nr:hypothetical protein [Mycobacteriaceae bacterium]